MKKSKKWKAYCTTLTKSPQQDRLTHDQFLYFNKHIKISNKTVYNKELLGCGLWRVQDLFDKENNIIPFNILQQRGASAKCYLKWRSIINIVKNKVERPFNKQNEMCYGIQVLDNENKSKDLLTLDPKQTNTLFVNKLKIQSNVQIKYSVAYDIHSDSWPFIYTLPRIVLKNNKIKEFQYKILHKYLPTNNILFKMKKISTYACCFCNIYRETIEHLFFECLYVINFWVEIQMKLYEILEKNITLSKKDILFGYGIDAEINKNLLINKIIMYGKYYVWKCKLNFQRVAYKHFVIGLKKHICYDGMLEPFCQ